ncbi:MAG: HicB family protein [Verrucomicrobiaceae bacterium]|nr:HicB family protein [Verrucomicrobiaceae bacterium]
MNYTMIIEQGEAAWWGYIPDAPGCAIGGETLAELLVVAPDVLAAHLEGCAPPAPRTLAEILADPEVAENLDGSELFAPVAYDAAEVATV